MHKFFFQLLLFLLPTQLSLHFWPDWATVLGRRVDYLSPTFYLTDALIILTLAFWFLEQQHKFSILNFQFLVKRENFQILIFKFIIVALFVMLNVSVANNKPVAAYRWLKGLEYGLLAFYIIKTKPPFSRVVFPLALGVFYSSAIAMGQFFLQHSVGGPLWWLGERTFNVDTPGIARFESCQLSAVSCQLFLRPYATFSHPNVLAGFLAVMLPLLVIQLSNNQILKLFNRKTLFYLTAVAIGLVALILSFSRSALIVAALGMGGTAWKIVKEKIVRRTLLVAGLILMFLAIFQFRNISPVDESIFMRQELNVAAIKLWQESPFFGIGLGNFLVRLPNVLSARTIYFLQPVHNIFLLILSETGIVGLGLFLWLIWKVMRKAIRDTKYVRRITKNKKFSDVSHFTYYISLFFLLLLGLVDHYPLTLQQGQLLLALLLSLSWTESSS